MFKNIKIFKKAFTLLEIMTVLLVVGIITAITVPMIMNLKDDAEIYETMRSKAEKDVYDAVFLALMKNKETVKDYSDVANTSRCIDNKFNSNECLWDFLRSSLSYDLACNSSMFNKFCWAGNWNTNSSLLKELNTRAVRITPQPAGFKLSNKMNVGVIYDPNCGISNSKTELTTVPVCGYILVDTNGDKGPNIYNQDQLIIELGKKGSRIEAYVSAEKCPPGQYRNAQGECVGNENSACVPVNPESCPCRRVTDDGCSCAINIEEMNCKCGFDENLCACNEPPDGCHVCVDGKYILDEKLQKEDECNCAMKPVGCACPVCENGKYTCKPKVSASSCECGVTADGCLCKEPPSTDKCYVCVDRYLGVYDESNEQKVDPSTCECGANPGNCGCKVAPTDGRCYKCVGKNYIVEEPVDPSTCECGTTLDACKCKEKPSDGQCYKCENGEYVAFQKPVDCECGFSEDGCFCNEPPAENCPCPRCETKTPKPYYVCDTPKDMTDCAYGIEPGTNECKCLETGGGCGGNLPVVNGSVCCPVGEGDFQGENTCTRCVPPQIIWDATIERCLCPVSCPLNSTQAVDCSCTPAEDYGCTDSNAILITSGTQLAQIGISDDYPLNGSYCLGNDIDLLSFQNWLPIGYASDGVGASIYPFTGRFDGNGKQIKNLKILREDDSMIGLFAHLNRDGEGVSIFNFGIKTADVSGKESVGIVVGKISKGSISSVYAEGEVKGVQDVGGITGSNAGVIENAYADVNINALLNEERLRMTYVGGLVGRNISGGRIANTYAKGSVCDDYDQEKQKRYIYIGGLVGSNQIGGIVENSFSFAKVEGTEFIGGLFGSVGAGSANKCYWASDLLSIPEGQVNISKDGIEKTQADMISIKNSKLYTDWSDSVWCFKCDSLPTLKNMPDGAPDFSRCASDCACEAPREIINGICDCPICPEGQAVRQEDAAECICTPLCDDEEQTWDPENKKCICPISKPFFNPDTNMCEECVYPKTWNLEEMECTCDSSINCLDCSVMNEETCDCEILPPPDALIEICGGCTPVCKNNEYVCHLEGTDNGCSECTIPNEDCTKCVDKEVPQELIDMCPCGVMCDVDAGQYICVAIPLCPEGKCLDSTGCQCIDTALACNEGFCPGDNPETQECVCEPQLTQNDCSMLGLCLAEGKCKCEQKPDCVSQGLCPASGNDCVCTSKPDCIADGLCPDMSQNGCQCKSREMCFIGQCPSVNGCECINKENYAEHCRAEGKCPSDEECSCNEPPECAEPTPCRSETNPCTCLPKASCGSNQCEATDGCSCVPRPRPCPEGYETPRANECGQCRPKANYS